MERNSIDNKYKWDLSKMYSSSDEFYHDLQRVKDNIDELVSFKDKITTSKEIFISFLTTNDTVERLINKLYCYAHLNCDVEPNNQEYQKIHASILTLVEQSSSKLTFINNELCQHDSIVKEYLNDTSLQDYRYSVENVLSYKPHLLDDTQEILLAKADSVSDVSSQVFNNMRLEFEDVEVNGKKEFLNNATLNIFLKNKDEKIRKQAYTNFFKEYKKFENVFATTLSGVMKKDAFNADVRKFDNSLEASVFNDDVPSDLFFMILDKANKQYRHLFHRYNFLKKKIINKDPLYNYDLSVPLVSSIKVNYNIEECFNIINQALKPFGKEYLDIINKAKKEHWIDYMPHTGKRIGAYSSGCYDSNPYILMNFIGDYNSLSTMIHELGHSVHTYLSNQNQSYVNSQYRIFVAEVASTVNETLLINHMINNGNDKQKAYFIYEQLENCVGLLFRQPMFAQFEYELHTMAENGEPLASKTITDLYAKMNKEYFGDAVTNDELMGWSCYYIPHFYYNYYVYKYTLGMTVALAIVKRILEGDKDQVNNYLEFLKSGGSTSPVELLKKAGVDPLDDKIYDDAFTYFEELLDKFEQIML